jgi:uncharacterized protein YaiE (UPF0345 family)
MSLHFEHVSIDKHANIYFDGSVISYNLRFPDHARKTIGVILPATVKFATNGPEIIEIVSGKCRVRVGNEDVWHEHEGGQRFQVPGQSSFEIEAIEPVHYVCHMSN